MKRGDIYLVSLNPTKGNEQRGERRVMIVSPDEYNKSQTPIIVPITQGGEFARNAGFTVSLMNTGLDVQGVVLCNQLRTLDLKARGGKYMETAPDYIISEVLAKIAPILDDE